MFRLPAEDKLVLLQPYLEGGDTYKGHQKYSLVPRYQCTPEGHLTQGWMDFIVTIDGNSTTVVECDSLDMDLTGYDRFRIFAMLPESVHLKCYCNGQLEVDQQGGYRGYYDGEKTKSKRLHSVRYELSNQSADTLQISIYYLGMLRDDVPQPAFFNDWEGCFAEQADTSLFNEHYLTREELEQFKEKIKQEPFRSGYEKIKKIALEAMECEPETGIGRTVRKFFHAEFRINGTAELALVGQVEQNEEMLKMACRNALSIACTEYWCMDSMETAPGITWHHRSFDEQNMLGQLSAVISFAGGMLSWHGRNVLYNAMITKGLPRIEADFMTMDYIYECNQGLFFMTGYLQGLITLADQYPRYKKRIEEAKALMDEMLKGTFPKDGSYHEGAMYWRCSIEKYLISAYFLSKYEHKTLKEFCGDKLNATANYGLSVLDENAKVLSFSDSRYNLEYGASIAGVLYAATGDERWGGVFRKNSCCGFIDTVIASTIEIPHCEIPFLDEFIYFESIGYARVVRDGILIAVLSGPSNNTHCHADKGSFMIHKDGTMICADCCGDYNNPKAMNLYRSTSHSLTVPVVKDMRIEQNKGTGFESVVETMECKNGVFSFACDNSDLWKTDEVLKNKRSILSKKANELIITDEFTFQHPARIEFRLNVTDTDRVKVTPLDWTPAEIKTVPLCDFDNVKVDQIRLLSNLQTQFCIQTKVEIL